MSFKKTPTPRKRTLKKTAKNGKCFFVLHAANARVIGKSELYESEKARDNGIASVIKNAPTATTDQASDANSPLKDHRP